MPYTVMMPGSKNSKSFCLFLFVLFCLFFSKYTLYLCKVSFCALLPYVINLYLNSTENVQERPQLQNIAHQWHQNLCWTYKAQAKSILYDYTIMKQTIPSCGLFHSPESHFTVCDEMWDLPEFWIDPFKPCNRRIALQWSAGILLGCFNPFTRAKSNQITNVCSVGLHRVLFLIYKTSQWNTYNQNHCDET